MDFAGLDIEILDEVLSAVVEHVFVVDRPGKIVYANLPLAQAWLVDRAELIGRTFADVASPAESVWEFDRMREEVFRSGAQANSVMSVAYRVIGRREMALRLSPIFEPATLAVRLVFGVAMDITPAAPTISVRGHAEPDHAVELSSRRREVLTLVAQGQSNKEIAAALHISVRTVESHRRAIAAQLQLATRADFFRYAKDAGYL